MITYGPFWVITEEEGSRIFSSYRVGQQKVWVITEADRSATTVLLAEDY